MDLSLRKSAVVFDTAFPRLRRIDLRFNTALLIFRILEKKAGKGYTAKQLIHTLREYNLLRINGEGYIPEYTRTKLTDRLHDVFGFRTDTEIVPTRNMRSIIASTKK